MYLFLNKRGSTRVKVIHYDNFNNIKKRVISILDSHGWDNKSEVDMRSLRSCINYIYYPDYELQRIVK